MDDLAREKEAAVPGGSVAGSAGLKQIVGRTEDVPRGIVMMIVATISVCRRLGGRQMAGRDYPVGEVLFLRSLSSFIACAAVILPVSGLSVFATHRPRDHLARGLSQSISQLACCSPSA